MGLSHEERLAAEVEIYKDQEVIHDLPEIFHYWSNAYIRPMFEEFGISHPDDLFINYFYKSYQNTQSSKPVFLSIGPGNCDTEVRVAKALLEKGVKNFTIECLEINPYMIERGTEDARREGVENHITFIQGDFNKWKADKAYDGIMANQSLHHVVELELLFSEVKVSLKPRGYFVVSDMIGRNGHMRWPEALEEVHRFWRELPEKYKYNQASQCYEELYENCDCSVEGFEGIRAQDILPLIHDSFNFELFVPFGNVINVFVDRAFGRNFDANSDKDRAFIDRVHEFDEMSFRMNTLTPTQMLAALCNEPVDEPKYSRGLTPEKCIRVPDSRS